MQGFHELLLEAEFEQAKQLLAAAELDMPTGVTFALGFFEQGTLVATGFLAGNIMCGLCVHPAYQGEGLAVQMVSKLLQQWVHAGGQTLFVYTKPQEAAKFMSLGFRLVATAPQAALLEWGTPSCETWVTQTNSAITHALPQHSTLGCIVMNANPFTLGHQHLVESAQAHCGSVVVFVVQEDVSVFPFSLRFELVQQGIAHIPCTIALPAGPYMVSQASFPSYFTSQAGHAAAYAALDSTIFATRIAPGLGIRYRFVGQEPYCSVTAAYNQALADILPAHHISLVEIPRHETNQQPISASTVRRLLKHPDEADTQQQLQHMVPPHVLQFLQQDPRAGKIKERLALYDKRH